jgi:hypothetical protein
MAGATADDHGHPRLLRAGHAHDAAGHAAHESGVRGDEAVGSLIREVCRVVEQAGHDTPAAVGVVIGA